MIKIKQEHIDEMIKHSRDEYPRECCGVLYGPNGTAEYLYRMTNTHSDPETSYAVDHEEQLKLWERIEENDHELAVIYHSHPKGPAYPSSVDVDTAHNHAVYVIIGDQEIKAFRISGGIAREVMIDAG